MNRDLPLSFVLRRTIVAAAVCGVLSLLAVWRSGATRPAAVVNFGQAPWSAATTVAVPDVTVLAVIAA